MLQIQDYNCVYCGMTAAERDHVVPHSFQHGTDVTRTFKKEEVVPACRECNQLLSNLMYTTVAERAGYLAKALAVRHKKLLKSPDWTEKEYAELSGRLLQEIKYQQLTKKVIEARIEYAQGISLLVNLAPENCWIL